MKKIKVLHFTLLVLFLFVFSSSSSFLFSSDCHSGVLGLFSTQFYDAVTCVVITVLD